MAKSSATSRPSVARPRHEAVEVGQRAEIGMDGVVAALDAADGPRAARLARLRRSARCCGPCGARGRSGGWAAGRRRRSPWPPRARSWASASRKVPWRPATPERGKNSYQAAKRARSRSTTTSYSRSAQVASVRSRWRSISVASAGVPRGRRPPSAWLGAPLDPRGPRGERGGVLRRWRGRRPPRTSAAPSRSSLATSWPASTRLARSASQERNAIGQRLDRVEVARVVVER